MLEKTRVAVNFEEKGTQYFVDAQVSIDPFYVIATCQFSDGTNIQVDGELEGNTYIWTCKDEHVYNKFAPIIGSILTKELSLISN